MSPSTVTGLFNRDRRQFILILSTSAEDRRKQLLAVEEQHNWIITKEDVFIAVLTDAYQEYECITIDQEDHKKEQIIEDEYLDPYLNSRRIQGKCPKS
jgi:hypothetical protein